MSDQNNNQALDSGSLPVRMVGGSGNISGSSTATTTTVASATSPTTLLAANTARKGATIANDSTSILYVLLGAGTVSATNYTYAIPAKTTVAAYYEVPYGFTGAITGLWSAVNGNALVTSFA